MQNYLYLIKSCRNMQKQNIFTLVTIVSLTIALGATISLMTKVNAQSFEPIPNTPKIAEDQVIVCVNHVEQELNTKHMDCHLYQADDLDYYQDSKDGSFFSHADSFEMGLID